MATKICFINQKGGVGKTTTTMQMASYLTLKMKKKVLMIDLDPQGNLTTGVGVSTDDENTICELLIDEGVTFEDTVVSTPYGDILPSDLSLGLREFEINSKIGRERLLLQAISKVEDKYDYILIDCPPAINVFTYNAFIAVNEIIVVSEMAMFSGRGCGKMIETVQSFIKSWGENGARIAGILLTKGNRTVVANRMQELIRQMGETYGVKVYDTVIGTYPAVIGGSQARCMSLFDYEPKHKATKEYTSAIKEILNSVEGK